MAVANHVGYLKKGNLVQSDPDGNDLEIIANRYAEYCAASKLTGQMQKGFSESPLIFSIAGSELLSNWDPSAYDLDRAVVRTKVLQLRPNCAILRDLLVPRNGPTLQRNHETRYFVSVLHVDEQSCVAWQSARSYHPKSKGIVCASGDILYSCINPSTPRATVIPKDIQGQVLCSSEFAVFRPIREDPYFIALALKSELSTKQLAPIARGTSSSRRRVSVEDVLDTLIPFPSASVRAQLASKFHQALDAARASASLSGSVLAEFEALCASRARKGQLAKESVA